MADACPAFLERKGRLFFAEAVHWDIRIRARQERRTVIEATVLDGAIVAA